MPENNILSLLFHTYISPEAYELFVKEISSKFNLDISKTKTVYDCCSCIIAVAMSFLFLGFWHFPYKFRYNRIPDIPRS